MFLKQRLECFLPQQAACFPSNHPLQPFGQGCRFRAVMSVARGKPRLDAIPLRIADPVSVEPQKPAFAGLPPGSKPGGPCMAIAILIVPHAYGPRIHEKQPVAPHFPVYQQKIRQNQQHTRHCFVRPLENIFVMGQSGKKPLI